MNDDFLESDITYYMTQGILICPIQYDMYDEVMNQVQSVVLHKIKSSDSIIGLIIDVSKIKIMDLGNISALEETLKMASLLGVHACLSGIRPAVAASLIELGYSSNKLDIVLDIEQGIAHIQRIFVIKEQEMMGLIDREEARSFLNDEEDLLLDEVTINENDVNEFEDRK